MEEADSSLLSRLLHLNLCLEPKLRWVASKPGVRSLDRETGLYLLEGSVEGSWLLEARTWGNPPKNLVNIWHQEALAVARRINPNGAFWPAWA